MERLRQALQADLITAMRQQDRATLLVLRSALSAIANAEAVEEPASSGQAVAGWADVDRKTLTPQQVKLVLLDEIEERRNIVGYYGTAGRHEEAQALEYEIDVLERYLYLT